MNPKTPDGVPEKEWAKVTKLALAAAAASGKADDAAAADVTQKLLTMLEALEQKFGPLPGILAARADFLDDPDEAVRLLERAYKIAGQRADVESRLTIADALAGCYIRELEDPKQGARWLAAMADALKQAGDENDVESYEELKADSPACSFSPPDGAASSVSSDARHPARRRPGHHDVEADAQNCPHRAALARSYLTPAARRRALRQGLDFTPTAAELDLLGGPGGARDPLPVPALSAAALSPSEVVEADAAGDDRGRLPDQVDLVVEDVGRARRRHEDEDHRDHRRGEAGHGGEAQAQRQLGALQQAPEPQNRYT